MQMFMPDMGLNDPMGLMGMNNGYAYVDALQYQINMAVLMKGDLEYITAKFLSDLILEAEVMFESDGQRLKLEKDFLRRFTDEWLPLRRQIFNELICLGMNHSPPLGLTFVGLVVVEFKPSWQTPVIITGGLGRYYNIKIIYEEKYGKLGKDDPPPWSLTDFRFSI